MAKRILHEIGESRFAGDLDPKLFHPVEQVIERLAIGQAALRDQLPRLLPQGSICLLEKRRHLRERSLLSPKVTGHGADDLLILLLELGQLSLARDVRLSKQSSGDSPWTVENGVAVVWQPPRDGESRYCSGSRSGSV